MKTHMLLSAMVAVLILGGLAAAVAADGPPAVEVHGWSLTRYYLGTTVDADRDADGIISNEEEDSQLEWERFSISGKARLAGGQEAYAEVYIHPWLPNTDPSFLYLESMYLDVPAAPGVKVRIGKGRSTAFGIVPSYGNRKTSNYSPLQEAFTMDRAVGIQLLQTKGADSLNVGVFQSQRPGARFIGMAADGQMDMGALGTTTVAHLVARDTPADRSGKLEISGRYGHQFDALNVGLSGRVGALDDTDAAWLASKLPDDYNGTNKTRLHYGFDATYKAMPWYATAEWYGGSLGGIELSGWSVLLGVEPNEKCTGIWREISPACKGLFVRYTDLNMDAAPSVSNAYTWDTQQWAVSYVLPVKLNQFKLAKWLQFEYERNTEDIPGDADDIPNDVLFAELFCAF